VVRNAAALKDGIIVLKVYFIVFLNVLLHLCGLRKNSNLRRKVLTMTKRVTAS